MTKINVSMVTIVSIVAMVAIFITGTTGLPIRIGTGNRTIKTSNL